MNDSFFNTHWDTDKKTGYKMASHTGYSGEKFSKKCFQRQLRELKDDGSKKITLEELHNSKMIEIPFSVAQQFILEYEWLGTMGVTKFSFGLYANSKLCAVYCFGLTAGTKTLSEPFGEEHKHEGIVLVRGACAPFAHPHTSSFGIGKAKELLRQKGYSFTIAYSDLEAGEIGTVYQATNWIFFGVTNSITYLVRPDGKRVDPKLIHKYSKKNNISRQEQIDIFKKEGYTFEKANPKLKYLLVVADRRKKKELMKKATFVSLPYLKREDDMKKVLQKAQELKKLSKGT